MCINVNAFPLGLPQQFLQSIQIMSCHYDTMSFDLILTYRDRLWNSEAFCMRPIQHIHDANRCITHLHRHINMLLDIKIGIR
ncbi:hypothetical protein D3C75_976750 [compost metagenome]